MENIKFSLGEFRTISYAKQINQQNVCNKKCHTQLKKANAMFGPEIGPDTLKNNQIISPSSIVCAPCAASRILYIVVLPRDRRWCYNYTIIEMGKLYICMYVSASFKVVGGDSSSRWTIKIVHKVNTTLFDCLLWELMNRLLMDAIRWVIAQFERVCLYICMLHSTGQGREQGGVVWVTLNPPWGILVQ